MEANPVLCGVRSSAGPKAMLRVRKDMVLFPCSRDAVDHDAYPKFPENFKEDERPESLEGDLRDRVLGLGT